MKGRLSQKSEGSGDRTQESLSRVGEGVEQRNIRWPGLRPDQYSCIVAPSAQGYDCPGSPWLQEVRTLLSSQLQWPYN